MSIIDKVCGKMGLLDPEDDKLNQEIEELSRSSENKREEQEEGMGMGHEDNSRNVVDFHSAASARENVVNSIKMKVIVIEPKTFDDAQQVASQRRGGAPGPGRRCRRVGLEFAQALHFGLGETAGLGQAFDQFHG